MLEFINEYNNSGALLGLEGIGGHNLLGELNNMPPIQKQLMVNRLTAPMRSIGSRAEMEKHFSELPQHIKEGLLKGELRLADTVIYSIKPANTNTIKLFETHDVKDMGIRNLANAKLPKNQAFLVSGIILLAGNAVDNTRDKIIGTAFDKVEAFPVIANGEFSLKANKKQIMPETSCNVFKTSNMKQVPIGYYKLANPRLIEDDVQIEMTIEIGSMNGLSETTYIYGAIHGTITTP